MKNTLERMIKMAKLNKFNAVKRFINDFPGTESLFFGEAAVKGGLITNRRTSLDYTQKELAEKTGLPAERIYLVEGGSVELDKSEYEKIFSALKITESDITEFRIFFRSEQLVPQ